MIGGNEFQNKSSKILIGRYFKKYNARTFIFPILTFNFYDITFMWGGYMHLIEIRENLQDTSVKTIIYDNSKIIRQLETLAEFTTDLSCADLEYVTSLLLKSRTLLNKAYTIFRLNNEEVQKNGNK